jgi:collagen triple helix repeat protein
MIRNTLSRRVLVLGVKLNLTASRGLDSREGSAMKVRFRLTRARAVLLVAAMALVLASLGAAVTSNAYTDSAGVYHGCVNSSNGNMRVVVAGDACKSPEVAIDWNQTGPQGIQGVKGDTGPQGIQGPKGDTGSQGIQGPKGDTGPQGIQGPKGDTGATGDTGARGATGPQGPKGDRGDTGPQGPAGAGSTLQVLTIVQHSEDAGPFGSVDAIAKCPPGYSALGGGFNGYPDADNIKISRPLPGERWEAYGTVGLFGGSIEAHVQCGRLN